MLPESETAFLNASATPWSVSFRGSVFESHPLAVCLDWPDLTPPGSAGRRQTRTHTPRPIHTSRKVQTQRLHFSHRFTSPTFPAGPDGRIVVNHHDFIPEAVAAAAPGKAPSVVVLYRPGHYDVLYAKEQ